MIVMNQNDMILITGTCGFIGFSLARRLLSEGYRVLGYDVINDYYDVNLKHDRNSLLQKFDNYSFIQADIRDQDVMNKVFKDHQIDYICHLAAQAGVRYSLTHPFEYQKANLEGFLNIIEKAKEYKVKNFVYASSSSVYGKNTKLPFSEKDRTDHPISLYGATKKANELIAHNYSHLFDLPTTGLRFFTVYGPWGRPDMALFLFTKAIVEDKTIDVFNYGKMRRSFTYVDDIVSGIIGCLNNPFAYEVFNLGNDRSASLLEYIENIEKCLGKEAKKNMLPLQPGDVPETIADLSHVREKIGFSPTTNIEEGIRNFIEWYREYYRV